MPRRLLYRSLSLAAFAAAACAPLAAQQALVLSGGGARGLAHIGVLQRLDELGYDPDLVVGTSMGAVVGALYAAGYDAEEIRARTLGVAWGGMFEPTPLLLGPARALRLPMFTFEFDPQEGRIGRGLFGEWRINRALVRLLFEANARARGDFDRLPRRYRAVAADLRTGEKVVIGRGDLARATRASMAYPGFFAPVEWNGRLLTDGGIADNLPTIEARRLGAEYIIAVDIARSPEEIESRDPFAIIQRSLNLMQSNLHPDPVPADIRVVPFTDAIYIGPAFPDDPVPLIELGLREARRSVPARPAGETRLPGRRALPPPARFAALRVEAPDSALAALARRAFAGLAPGPFDPDAVLAAVDRLYGTGLVDGVWPQVLTGDAANGSTLLVRVDAPAGFSLAADAGYENDRGGRIWGALEHNTSLARRPVVFTLTAATDGIHRSAALSARLHTGLALAWSAGAHVHENGVRTFRDDARTTLEIVRAGGWAGIELPHILRQRLITLTGLAEWIEPEDSAASAPDAGGSAFGPRLRIAELPSDRFVVGAPLLLEAEARWGTFDYRRLTAAGSLRRATRTMQAALSVDARVVSDHAPADALPALGDEHAVPGLRWGERRDRARAVAGLDFALAAPFGGFARLRLRSGAVAAEPADWTSVRWTNGAQLAGVWRAPFGTVEVGYGLATIGDGRFDVSLGRPF